MKRYQLNLLSIAIILLVVSLSFLIYYQYSMNVKKEQEKYIFENFINSLQNLENTINSIQGTYYVKVDIPNGVILFANGTELIIQYNNNNYTINFYKNVTIYNNNQNVSFLYPNNYIYLVSTNDIIFITTNFQNSIYIFNQYLPNGTLIYITPENNQNNNNQNNGGNNQGNNNINPNAQCLVNYNGQTSFFWGDVNGNDYLPPIGDQGNCGDCWAFASSNGIASIYMIRNNQPNEGLQLSPAYIAIECNYGYPNAPGYCNNIGCIGGQTYPAILFTSQYGIPPDPGWSYYESTLYGCPGNSFGYPGDVCNYNYNGPSSPLYYPQGVINLEQNGPLTDQQIIQDLLCYGPLVAAGMLAAGGGSDPNTNPQPPFFQGHAMLLVGYTEDSQLCEEVYGTHKCWIFENQWGDITGCLLFGTNGEPLGPPSQISPAACGEYYLNGEQYGGVYWIQDGYMYVPFNQSPYGLTFTGSLGQIYGDLVAIQNVTLS